MKLERGQVKRYDMVGDRSGSWRDVQANESDRGPWVGYSDYAAMETRALAAEDRIREAVEVLLYRGNGLSLEGTCNAALAILTRDPVPEPVRKPEVTP